MVPMILVMLVMSLVTMMVVMVLVAASAVKARIAMLLVKRAVAEVVFAEIDRIKTKLRLCKVAAIAFVRTRSRTDVRCSPLDVPPP